jgi:hypothetical protein
MDGLVTPGVEPQPQPPSPPKKMHFILGCVGITLGLFLAFFRAWLWSYGLMGAQAWGYAMGSAMLPALIAFAIAGRREVRNFNRFGIWFSGLSLCFFLVSSSVPVSLQQHVGNLMKEAAGTKAVDNNGPGNFDDLIRDMMRGILEDRKAFDRETDPYAAELGKLYSIDTFSSAKAMQGSIDAVRGITAADERYSKQLEGLPARIQGYVDRSRLSDSDKRDFMAGIQKSDGDLKTLQIRRQAMGTEKQWEDATVGLYQFTIANQTLLQVDGATLRISSERVRRSFDDQMTKAQKLRDDLAKQNAQLESAQREALQQAGITPKDIGLPEGDEPKKK